MPSSESFPGYSALLNDHGEQLTASHSAGQVLIVILNFNGIDDTLECLESLRGQTFRDIVVQVIDNGSKTDDLSRIATRFPEAEVIALPENLGWAGGNNIGIGRLSIGALVTFACSTMTRYWIRRRWKRYCSRPH